MINENWNNTKTQELFKAFLTLQSIDEAADFCRDLMTEDEITEFALRLEVAKALSNGATQRQAAKATGASIATVTRVNRWLNRGMQGYSKILFRMEMATKEPLRTGLFKSTRVPKSAVKAIHHSPLHES